MPVQSCSEGGKPGFKWGEGGACYVYDPSSPKSKLAARIKAGHQGTAIAFSKAKAAGRSTPSSGDFHK